MLNKVIIVLLVCAFGSLAQAADDPKAGVAALKAELLKLGEPKLEGEAEVFGTKVPGMKFGTTAVTMNYKVVDQIKKTMGCTATIFVKNGEEYVRVSTNVLKDDGTRAVATSLARNKAYDSIKKGEMFCGDVEILGKPYSTCYDPIKAGKDVIGIYYFGCKK